MYHWGMYMYIFNIKLNLVNHVLIILLSWLHSRKNIINLNILVLIHVVILLCLYLKVTIICGY